jgi:hypothetical protein
MLANDKAVPLVLVLFDVLELDGKPTIRLPYRRRRELLELLDFAGVCQLCPRFDDGAALWHAIREHQLEGVVAKRLDEPTGLASGRGSRRRTRTGRATRRSAKQSSATEAAGRATAN